MNYYLHKKSGKRYSMLQECKIKFGDSWVKGIVYLADGKIFCRTSVDFYDSFVKETK